MAETPIEVDYGEPMTYTLAQLEAQAMTFLQESKIYKHMRARDKQELAALKARAAKREAENLISADQPDFVVWPRVIRTIILEVNSD